MQRYFIFHWVRAAWLRFTLFSSLFDLRIPLSLILSFFYFSAEKTDQSAYFTALSPYNWLCFIWSFNDFGFAVWLFSLLWILSLEYIAIGFGGLTLIGSRSWFRQIFEKLNTILHRETRLLENSPLLLLHCLFLKLKINALTYVFILTFLTSLFLLSKNPT